MKIKTLSLILIAVAINSFTRAQQRSAGQSSAANKKTDIYLAGCIYSPQGGGTTAAYSKNGVLIIMPGVSKNSEINAIEVVGNDIYVAGRDEGQVVYWKNGQRFALTDKGATGYVSRMLVYKGDAYVVGIENDPIRGRNYLRARLWKNGISLPLDISKGVVDSRAQCIAIDTKTDDIYVAGTDNNFTRFWKNGVIMQFANGGDDIFPYDMAITDNDVYIAGYEENYVKKPAYVTAKKGKTVLANYGKIFSIAAVSNDVYFAGFIDEKEKYWKNNVAFDLGDVGNDPFNSPIAVIGNDVHVASGWKYWKNGLRQQTVKDLFINDIALVSNGSTSSNTISGTPPLKKTKPAVTTNNLPSAPITESKKFLEENKAKPTVITTPSGLQYEVLQRGTGPKPNVNDKVKFNYRKTSWVGTENKGTTVSSSPMNMKIEDLRPGLSEALQLMNVGSRYKLTLPPNLGAGVVVPGYADGSIIEVWDVELLGIEAGTVKMQAPVSANVITNLASTTPAGSNIANQSAIYSMTNYDTRMFLERNMKKPGVVTTASGLQYQRMNQQIDGNKPSATDRVKIRFYSAFMDDILIESTMNELPRTVLVSSMIPGLKEGLQLMSVGCKYLFVLPPNLAYGSQGDGNKIPPDAAIKVYIELLDIVK